MPKDFLAVVRWQLRRQPEIRFSVASSCVFGWPAVIKNEVFTNAGRPNPNLFYLTCPYLVRKISGLEDAGLTRRIQQQILSDAALAENLIAANRKHASMWLSDAGEASRRFSIEPPNITGAGDPLSVKCLHAHLAYFLIDQEHRVGALVAAGIHDFWCSDERCRHYAASSG